MTDTAVDTEAIPEQMSLADLSKLMHAGMSAKSRIAELEQTAVFERSRIDDWLEQETASDRKTIAYIEAVCETWMRQRLRDRQDGDKKSVTTPYGTISSREQPLEYLRDDEVLREFAEARGLMREKVTREVDWKTIKDKAVATPEDGHTLLLLDGELVPGVEVVAREPKISVEIAFR